MLRDADASNDQTEDHMKSKDREQKCATSLCSKKKELTAKKILKTIERFCGLEYKQAK